MKVTIRRKKYLLSLSNQIDETREAMKPTIHIEKMYVLDFA